MFFCHQPGKKILLIIQLNQNGPNKPILMKPAKGHDKDNNKISHLGKIQNGVNYLP